MLKNCEKAANMPSDALTYHFIAKELNDLLVGGKIEKINMPENDEVFLTIRAQRERQTLILCAGNNPRVHITNAQKENPLVPPAFCMNLRKNIGGGIIKSISTYPFERIIFIDIFYKNELGVRNDKRLICEIMGKYSNIVICDENRKILECLKHIPLDISKKRQLLPGLIYEVPTQDKLTPLDSNGIKQIKFSEDPYLDIMNNVMGLAPVTVTEAIFNANISQINENAIERIADELKNLYLLPLKPCLINGKDFFIRPYNSIKGDYLYFESINKAMDAFFTDKDFSQRLSSKSKALLSSVKSAYKRTEKRLSEFLIRLKECENYQNDRILGEILTANMYKLKPGMASIVLENFYDGQNVEIKLDPTLSPAANAQKYFDKYNKKKRTIEATSKLIEKTKEEKQAYEAIIFSLENVTELNELNDIAEEMALLGLIKARTKNKHEKPSSPLMAEVNGFKILIGKNNIQNERLFKNAAKNDIWLHTRLIHGSHVIIQTENRQVPENVLLTAAQYAAYYSKARNSDKVEVDYTLVKNVSKPSGAALGKVVYKNQKTIIVTPKPIERI